MNQEQLIQLQTIEQEANQFNQQFQLIEQNISEMQRLDESLSEMDKLEKNEEMLINIGKKIFVPVKINDKKLIVDVGNKKLVKKSISETRGIIEEQLKRLIAAKTDIMEKLQELEAGMEQIIRSINKESKDPEHKNNHGYECKCEDDECNCEERC